MSRRFLIKLAALASTCWMSVGYALAENRIALVIGNANYTSVTALPNPANDAKAMTTFLHSAGFEVVQAPDLTQSDMRRTIGNFATRVAAKGPDTVALVFYAGHGLQVDGENFLVPIDAQIQREADVPLQSMRLADLMHMLSSVPSKTRIVILDACRNNPFSAINKTTGRGLAIVDAPNGSLVSYSTAPGTEALDGDGVNSPYTTALLQIGKEPGLPIEQALKRVRLAVSGATHQQQFPWESSSLTADFSFLPAAAGQEHLIKASTGNPRTAAGSRTEGRSVESWRKELKPKSLREAYEIVILEDKIEAYQAYLALYPSESMAPVVRSLLDRRQVVIAWHTAVTINTVASYQAFLASYGSSDFRETANRLIERARARSVSNPSAAFAAVGPACPCSQPVKPSSRQRRTDLAPTQTPNPGPNSPTGANSPKSAAPTGVAVYDPPPVRVYTDPVPPTVTTPELSIPIVTRPPRVRIPPHGKKPERPSGYDKPERSSGYDKPKSTDVSHDKPQLTRGRINQPPRIRISTRPAIDYGRTVRSPKSSWSPVPSGKAMQGHSVVPRQSFGQMGMMRNRSFGQIGMPRMSTGHMGMARGHGGAPRMSFGGMGRSFGGMGFRR